jgi:hypothetical protein
LKALDNSDDRPDGEGDHDDRSLSDENDEELETATRRRMMSLWRAP